VFPRNNVIPARRSVFWLAAERIIEQGGIAKRAFNAIDGTIDNMTTTIVFSYYKPNPCREIVKEQ
jgi:hypothetical protein